MYYTWNFAIKNCKKWYKVTFLNGFSDYVYLKNEKDINKLYKISNEYNINKEKQYIIDYIKNDGYSIKN